MTRHEIVQSAISTLKDIKKANGFSCDVVDVFDWLDRPLGKEEYPVIVVSDPSSKNEQKQMNEHHLTLFTDLYIVGDASKLRAFSNDVIQKMFDLESTINYSISYKSSEFKHQQGDFKYYAGALEFEILYHPPKGEQ